MIYAITLASAGAGYLASNFISKQVSKKIFTQPQDIDKIISCFNITALRYVAFGLLGLAIGSASGVILNKLAFSAFTAKTANVVAGAAAGVFASIFHYSNEPK